MSASGNRYCASPFSERESTALLDEPTAWRASFETGGSPGTRDFLPGDVDGNDRVNLLDLTVVQRSVGILAGATRATGDLNGDGAVNRADVAWLAMSFGRQYPASAESPAAAVVASVERETHVLLAPSTRAEVRRTGNSALRAADVDRAIVAESSQLVVRLTDTTTRRALRRSPM